MMERPLIQEKLMTVADVAEYLQVSQCFVRQHSNGMRKPHIPSMKLGGAIRFRRASIEAFVKDLERAA